VLTAHVLTKLSDYGYYHNLFCYQTQLWIIEGSC